MGPRTRISKKYNRTYLFRYKIRIGWNIFKWDLKLFLNYLLKIYLWFHLIYFVVYDQTGKLKFLFDANQIGSSLRGLPAALCNQRLSNIPDHINIWEAVHDQIMSQNLTIARWKELINMVNIFATFNNKEF